MELKETHTIEFNGRLLHGVIESGLAKIDKIANNTINLAWLSNSLIDDLIGELEELRDIINKDRANKELICKCDAEMIELSNELFTFDHKGKLI